jgi:hypothetical protein
MGVATFYCGKQEQGQCRLLQISVRRNTRFSITRNKDLYGIVMSGGDITIEAIKNNPDVDSRVHPFAEALVKYFNMKDDELGKPVDGFKAEMEDKNLLFP